MIRKCLGSMSDRPICTVRGVVCGLALLFLITATAPLIQAQERPNILFVVSDDLNTRIGPYVDQSLKLHTPNLDQLSRGGASFENAFVTTPVCSPSRATLLTGRYASEFGILDWIPPASHIGLDTAAPVWPRLLHQAGYRTGLVGKWHVGHLDGLHPLKFGYDEFVGILTGGTAPKDPTLEVDGKNQVVSGLTMDIFTDSAHPWDTLDPTIEKFARMPPVPDDPGT